MPKINKISPENTKQNEAMDIFVKVIASKKDKDDAEKISKIVSKKAGITHEYSTYESPGILKDYGKNFRFPANYNITIKKSEIQGYDSFIIELWDDDPGLDDKRIGSTDLLIANLKSGSQELRLVSAENQFAGYCRVNYVESKNDCTFLFELCRDLRGMYQRIKPISTILFAFEIKGAFII